MKQQSKRKLTKQLSKQGSYNHEEEGMIGFSNKYAEEILRMKMEADGANFDMENEEIKQFRNSIYNFNRIGVPKTQIRAKMFNKTSTPGMTSENFNDAKRRYQENLSRVDEYMKESSKKLVSKQLTKKIAESGKTQAIGQMLGHKVDFQNLDHATKTMIQLRKHGIQQQLIAQKQEIQKIASALDQQIYSQRKFVQARSANKSPFTRPSQSINFDNQFGRNFFNQTMEDDAAKSRNASSNTKMPSVFSERISTLKTYKGNLQPISNLNSEINDNLQSIPIKYKQDSGKKHILKLKEAHNSIKRINQINKYRSPVPILQGEILQKTLVLKATKSPCKEVFENSLNDSFEKLNALRSYSQISVKPKAYNDNFRKQSNPMQSMKFQSNNNSLQYLNKLDKIESNKSLQQQENSLVNLGDSIQHDSDFNLDAHAYNSFDPNNLIIKQPSIGEILEKSYIQVTQNLDQSYTLSHRRPSNKCLPGTKDMPAIKVTQRKKENVKILKIIEILQPRKEKEPEKSQYQATVHTVSPKNSTIGSNMTLRVESPYEDLSRMNSNHKKTKGSTKQPNTISKIPGMKTVQEYEQEKEQEEIFNTLKNFKNLSEINRQFGQTLENFSPRDPSEKKGGLMIPHNRKYFERFYELKQEILDHQKAQRQSEENNDDPQDSYRNILNQVDVEYLYNISSVDDSRIKLLAGEGGSLLQTGIDSFIYQGGFMGNQFNFRLGLFKFEYGHESTKILYDGNLDTNNIVCARMGHLAFYDSFMDQIVIFGGQRSGDKYKQTNQRLMMNDVIVFDHKEMKVMESVQFSEGAVESRIYCSGFKIDQKLYVIGGMANNGQLLNNFIEIDYRNKYPQEAIIEKGKGLIEKMHSSAIAAVFYESKIGENGDLRLSSITGETNWGETEDLIKHEGFYMFGGRLENNQACNTLLIFKISMDKKQVGRASFKIFKPKTLGMPPCARYMHSINLVPKLNQLVIYGGRNDFLPQGQILGDVFILKLNTLEWIKLAIGGNVLPSERCNHSSLVHGSELIICGGQNNSFQLMKDMLVIELDQEKVKRTSPYIAQFATNLKQKLKDAEVKRISKVNNLQFAPLIQQ